jgi:Tol biopolymer transport system component
MNKINKSTKSSFLWGLCIVLVGIVIVQFIFLQKKIAESDPPQGRIIFRRRALEIQNNHDFEYFIMDGDGNSIQLVWYYRGDPTWSPDGEYFVVSCEDDVSKICIKIAGTIPDLRSFPREGGNVRLHPLNYKVIDLPVECNGLINPVNGLESISWSPDGQKIVVVCGDYWTDDLLYTGTLTPRKVCILPVQEGESFCWEDLDFLIIRAEWSPVEDLLVITSKEEVRKIYLVGPDGKDPIHLTDGITAVWSPDGQQIAFTLEQTKRYWEKKGTPSFDETFRWVFGIAVINKDGSGFRWLYQDPDTPELQGDDITFGCGPGCPLSWSPDGRYIVFQAELCPGGCYQILRFEMETKEMVCLSCFNHRNYGYADPDWGP